MISILNHNAWLQWLMQLTELSQANNATFSRSWAGFFFLSSIFIKFRWLILVSLLFFPDCSRERHLSHFLNGPSNTAVLMGLTWGWCCQIGQIQAQLNSLKFILWVKTRLGRANKIWFSISHAIYIVGIYLQVLYVQAVYKYSKYLYELLSHCDCFSVCLFFVCLQLASS